VHGPDFGTVYAAKIDESVSVTLLANGRVDPRDALFVGVVWREIQVGAGTAARVTAADDCLFASPYRGGWR
jgi:hypothetical protein